MSTRRRRERLRRPYKAASLRNSSVAVSRPCAARRWLSPADARALAPDPGAKGLSTDAVSHERSPPVSLSAPCAARRWGVPGMCTFLHTGPGAKGLSTDAGPMKDAIPGPGGPGARARRGRRLCPGRPHTGADCHDEDRPFVPQGDIHCLRATFPHQTP